MIERMTLRDAATADLLAHERRRHILLALVERERSQQELTLLLRMPANLLHYHLARLVAAGLAVVSRSAARRGRAVLHYRAAAASFFVPAELSAELPDRRRWDALRMALERGRAGTYSGLLYGWDDGPRMQVVRESAAGPIGAELWHRLTLSREDARAMIDELRRLFARYEARSTASGEQYLVLSALAATSGP